MLDEYSLAVEQVYYEGAKQVTIDGVTYDVVAIEYNVDSRRWADQHMLVLRNGENHVGLVFDIGSTELQEDMGFFEYSRQELVPVKSQTVIQWIPA